MRGSVGVVRGSLRRDLHPLRPLMPPAGAAAGLAIRLSRQDRPDAQALQPAEPARLHWLFHPTGLRRPPPRARRSGANAASALVGARGRRGARRWQRWWRPELYHGRLESTTERWCRRQGATARRQRRPECTWHGRCCSGVKSALARSNPKGLGRLACSGPPFAPERSALAAWVPKRRLRRRFGSDPKVAASLLTI